ncbi:MAG: copper oxidase [Alphaproteobacteria bacterium]|nr:MAG: copper oxidase [Alphaproteobacteria bacterium]
MADRIFRWHRRELLAGLGAAALGPAMPRFASAQGHSRLTLQARAAEISLRPGQPGTSIWALQGSPPDPALRFKRGDELEVAFQNDLPVATVLNWRGLAGIPGTEPLTTRQPVSPGGKENLSIALRRAGTFLCDLRLLGDGQARPLPVRPVIVAESDPLAIDREQVFLVEDWRLRPDGSPIAPGLDPADAPAIYTVNGQMTLDIAARSHERFRFRFINGCQRAAIALKIENHEVRVMALDSEPTEPFPARNGAMVLAPGGRADAFVDVSALPGSASSILLHDGKDARPIGRLIVAKDEPPLRDAALPTPPPLPANGLPAQIELKGALRIDVTVGRPQPEWVLPVRFVSSAAPAFRAKAGRTVVLALANRGDIPAVFHLHGHHFRVLDRLDDGWKPFWLDTLAIDSGQTQRIAFAAEHSGHWLMEAMATDWAAPRFVRWYSIE